MRSRGEKGDFLIDDQDVHCLVHSLTLNFGWLFLDVVYPLHN